MVTAVKTNVKLGVHLFYCIFNIKDFFKTDPFYIQISLLYI